MLHNSYHRWVMKKRFTFGEEVGGFEIRVYLFFRNLQLKFQREVLRLFGASLKKN
jgi:hypothetical protein